MPTSKEMLLHILNRAITAHKDKISPFQIECLDMFQKKINAIKVDETAEMDLQICNILLDKCFCDLEDMIPRERRIISLLNKPNLTDDEFYTKVSTIFNHEIKELNSFLKDTFYDQTFKNVKMILIDMKTELTRLKTGLEQQPHNEKTLSCYFS
ncbi:Uncharacterised protein [Legionella steigerwaltii]|uniref:Uncharacterized protein n=1 Tax=Legionella steigerwaltii TaxID=460 RepID=A0A378L8V4_9GAMM|nr:hypothetical protein [Legionella steigerwaltii]KTD80260.1 hypothetical protein Lstg_0522 [Legionella steigerwaltii]STY22342.1 Uncharacterised protein [Legionella steigerwaltii]